MSAPLTGVFDDSESGTCHADTVGMYGTARAADRCAQNAQRRTTASIGGQTSAYPRFGASADARRKRFEPDDDQRLWNVWRDAAKVDLAKLSTLSGTTVNTNTVPAPRSCRKPPS